MHRPASADETLAELIREPGELSRATFAAEHGGPSLMGGVLQLASKEAVLDTTSGTRSLNFGGRVRRAFCTPSEPPGYACWSCYG